MNKLPKFIATSVVRGSQQGESHGGIYTLDFDQQVAEQHVDWNTGDIDFEGRGADRGLRGIAFDGNDIYVAASDELFCYDRNFRIQSSYRNRYLKHCHEIVRKDRLLFLTSTGFDSLLVFNIDRKAFIWGINLLQQTRWSGLTFDPRLDVGPQAANKLHLNNVFVDDTGIYLSGLRAPALLHINSQNEVSEVCSLPLGTHNARPYRDGLLFNDTASDALRYVARDGQQQVFRIKRYPESEIRFAGIDDSNIARQGFGRGLCVVGDRFVAGGSSPSTISLYDIDAGQLVGSVNISMDIRNAIHGLEVFPQGKVNDVV
jgi:hypothetical protein